LPTRPDARGGLDVPTAAKAVIKRVAIRAAQAWTRAHHRLVLGSAAPFRGERIRVDPRDIRGNVKPDLKRHLERRTGCQGGVVVGGSWDIDLVDYHDFRTTLVYESCHARWVEGKRWEDTPLVQVYLERLANGVPNRFASVQEAMERYNALDRIFEHVVSSKSLSDEADHLVQISITRDRSLLWGPDGRHRVCIALIAGLTSMPAKVGYVHAQSLAYFQTLRDSRPGLAGERSSAAT
jgi:hypothetical protein